jgi:hypothetical protein
MVGSEPVRNNGMEEPKNKTPAKYATSAAFSKFLS